MTLRSLTVLLALLASQFVVAAGNNTDVRREKSSGDSDPFERGDLWTVAMENDLLAGGHQDKDYTFSLNITYSGPGARDAQISPYGLQRHLDRWLPGQVDLENHSLEFGFYGFTPDNTSAGEPIYDDRPYASMLYLQSNREAIDVQRGVGWTSSLSLGVLGLDFAGDSQNRIHKLTNSGQAQGWNHQISAGGELSAKYAVARQKYWRLEDPNLELKTSTQASLGYLTELSYSVSLRAGRIRSGWWSFDPELVAYGERSGLTSGSSVAEHYFWGGLAVKYRAYNAFLQGQFRDSEVKFAKNDLHHLLVEAWLGYTLGFNNGYRVSYWLRGHSSEIKDGLGDRYLLWGGLVLSKSF